MAVLASRSLFLGLKRDTASDSAYRLRTVATWRRIGSAAVLVAPSWRLIKHYMRRDPQHKVNRRVGPILVEDGQSHFLRSSYPAFFRFASTSSAAYLDWSRDTVTTRSRIASAMICFGRFDYVRRLAKSILLHGASPP
jgi:hypothetical protein